MSLCGGGCFGIFRSEQEDAETEPAATGRNQSVPWPDAAAGSTADAPVPDPAAAVATTPRQQLHAGAQGGPGGNLAARRWGKAVVAAQFTTHLMNLVEVTDDIGVCWPAMLLPPPPRPASARTRRFFRAGRGLSGEPLR